jgi:hypothetical protein
MENDYSFPPSRRGQTGFFSGPLNTDQIAVMAPSLLREGHAHAFQPNTELRAYLVDTQATKNTDLNNKETHKHSLLGRRCSEHFIHRRRSRSTMPRHKVKKQYVNLPLLPCTPTQLVRL